jgi:hypothetical protein
VRAANAPLAAHGQKASWSRGVIGKSSGELKVQPGRRSDQGRPACRAGRTDEPLGKPASGRSLTGHHSTRRAGKPATAPPLSQDGAFRRGRLLRGRSFSSPSRSTRAPGREADRARSPSKWRKLPFKPVMLAGEAVSLRGLEGSSLTSRSRRRLGSSSRRPLYRYIRWVREALASSASASVRARGTRSTTTAPRATAPFASRLAPGRRGGGLPPGLLEPCP